MDSPRLRLIHWILTVPWRTKVGDWTNLSLNISITREIRLQIRVYNPKTVHTLDNLRFMQHHSNWLTFHKHQTGLRVLCIALLQTKPLKHVRMVMFYVQVDYRTPLERKQTSTNNRIFSVRMVTFSYKHWEIELIQLKENHKRLLRTLQNA